MVFLFFLDFQREFLQQYHFEIVHHKIKFQYINKSVPKHGFIHYSVNSFFFTDSKSATVIILESTNCL